MVARAFLVPVVVGLGSISRTLLATVVVVARAFLVAVIVGLGQRLLEQSWWQWLWLLEHSQ